MTVAEIVANHIIEKMEEAEKSGTRYYWIKPFAEGSPRQALSYEKSVPYNGINRLLLDADEYLTFNKIKEMGCSIRKGAKSSMVVFFKQAPQIDRQTGEVKLDEDGNEVTYGCLRYYHVFSRQDVIDKDGVNLPSKLDIKQYSHDDMSEQIKIALSLFMKMVQDYCYHNNIQMEFINEGTSAYYMPSRNLIRIPAIENFKSVYEYMHTIAHEVVHSTMKPLKREPDKNGKTLDEITSSYSKEELVAEIGAEMIIQTLGVPDDREYTDNHIAYIQGWSRYLQDKKQELVFAAAKAQDACDYVLEYTKEIKHDISNDERDDNYDL